MRLFFLVSLIIGFLYAKNEKLNDFFYSSIFGFQVDNVSKSWTLVGNKSSSSLLTDMIDKKVFSHYDQDVMKDLKEKIKNNELEMLIYDLFSDSPFKDNISVTSLPSKISLLKKQKETCSTLENDFKGIMKNQKIKMKYCEVKTIDNIDVFTYLIDNYSEKIMTIVYIFNTNENPIRFTLTCNSSKCNYLKNETEGMIKKMQFISKTNTVEYNETIIHKQKDLIELNPSIFCKPDGYFINCYKVNEQECSTYIFHTTAKCINESNVDFTNNQNFQHMGEIIGRCVGEEFSLHYENRYIKNEKCDKPSNFF